MLSKENKFIRRQQRVRTHLKKIYTGRVRLSVHRTHKNIYVQLINDLNHTTLASASTFDKSLRIDLSYGGNVLAAKSVGQLIAKKARDLGIENVVFDRGGYLYHGRVKALAEAARAGGLKF